MMKKSILFAICTLSFIPSANSQTFKDSIDEQFIGLTQQSSNWQNYKVVEKGKLHQLHQNVLIGVQELQKQIEDRNAEFEEQTIIVNEITAKLVTTETALTEALERENNLEVLGLATSKSSFKVLMCVIIGILLLSLGMLYIQFKKSYSDTKDARKKLEETDLELEDLKKRSLEREQKIRRQLQDEINKNRKSQTI